MVVSFDKAKKICYDIDMDFKLKEMTGVLLVPKIANVHFFEFPVGHETKEDKHPFCELVFVNEGTLQVRSEKFSGTLSKGGFILHGANEVHALACSKTVETSLIIIGFECRNETLSFFTEKPVYLSESEIKQLARIVKEGRNVFAPPYDVPVYDMIKKKEQVFGSEQILRSLLETFLIGLIRKYALSQASEEAEEVDFKISEIVEYVDDNFTEKMTLDELAFLFHTNRSTLCKEFRIATGKTVVGYIIDKKVESAKRLLAGKKSITQIADELRFESVPYFCKFFKKYAGVTPAGYRREIQ